MKNEVAYLLFFDIQNTHRFFEVVDRCTAPITLCLQDGGQVKDLRLNSLVQYLLIYTLPFGIIPRLELKCNNSRDMEQLMQFMMEDYIIKRID